MSCAVQTRERSAEASPKALTDGQALAEGVLDVPRKPSSFEYIPSSSP